MKTLKMILAAIFTTIAITDVSYPILGTRRREAMILSSENKKGSEAAYEAGLASGQNQQDDFRDSDSLDNDVETQTRRRNEEDEEDEVKGFEMGQVMTQMLSDDKSYADDESVVVQAFGDGSIFNSLSADQKAKIKKRLMSDSNDNVNQTQDAQIQAMNYEDDLELEEVEVQSLDDEYNDDLDYPQIQGMDADDDSEDVELQSLNDEYSDNLDYAQIQAMDADDDSEDVELQSLDDEYSDNLDYAQIQAMDADDDSEEVEVQSLDDEYSDNLDYAQIQAMDADDDSKEFSAVANLKDAAVVEPLVHAAQEGQAMVAAVRKAEPTAKSVAPVHVEPAAPAIHAEPVIEHQAASLVAPVVTPVAEKAPVVAPVAEKAPVAKTESYSVYNALSSVVRGIESAVKDMANYLYSFFESKSAKNEVKIQVK